MKQTVEDWSAAVWNVIDILQHVQPDWIDVDDAINILDDLYQEMINYVNAT
jgi:hypothetical protein